MDPPQSPDGYRLVERWRLMPLNPSKMVDSNKSKRTDDFLVVDPMYARNIESTNPSTGVAVTRAFDSNDIASKARKAKNDGIIQRRLNQIQQEEITRSLAKRKSRVGSSKDKTPTKASESDLSIGAVAEHAAEEGNHTSPERRTLYEEDFFEIRMPKKEYLRKRHNEKRKERRKLKRERDLSEASRRSSLIVKLKLQRDRLSRGVGASPIRKTSFIHRLKTAHLKNAPSTTTDSSQSPSLLKAQTEEVQCQNLVEAEGENFGTRTTEDETFPDLGLEGLMIDNAQQVSVSHAQNSASMTRTPTPSFTKAAGRPRPQSSSTPQSQAKRFATPQAPQAPQALEKRPPLTSTLSQRSLTLPMRPPTPSIVSRNSNPEANNEQLSDDMVHVITAFPKDIKECPFLRIIGTTDPADELLKDRKTKNMYGQTFDCQWRVFALYNTRGAVNHEYKPWLSGNKWIKDDILIMKAPGDELGHNATRRSHPKLELNLDRFKHPTPNEDGSHTYRIPKLFKIMVEIKPLLPSYPPLGLHNISKLSPTARDCIQHTSAHVNQVRLLASVDYNKDDSGLVKCDIQTYLGDNTEFPRNFPPAKKDSEMSRLRGEAIKNTEHPTPFKLAIEITWPSWCNESVCNEQPKDDDEQITMPEDIAPQGIVMQIPDDMPQQFSLDRPPSAPDPVPVINPANSNSNQGARSPIVPARSPLELLTAMRYGIVQLPATSSGVTNTTRQRTSDAIDLTEEDDAPPQGGNAVAAKPVEVIDLDDSDNDEGAIKEMPNPPNSLAPKLPAKHGHPSPLTSTMSRLLPQSDYVMDKQQAQSPSKTTSAHPSTIQERPSTPLPRSTSLPTWNQATTEQVAPEGLRQQTSAPLPISTSLAKRKLATTGQTADNGASREEQSTFISCVWMVADEKNQKIPKTWKDHRCHICNAKFPNFLSLRDHLASLENHAEYKSIRIRYDKAGSGCNIWARLQLTGKYPLTTTKVFEEVQDSPESEQAWSWLPSLPLPPPSVALDKAAAPASPLRPSTGSPISIQHHVGIDSTSKPGEVPLRMDIIEPTEHDHDEAAMKPVSPDYQRPPRPQPRNSGVPMNWNMNIVHDPVTRQPLDRDTSIPQYPQPEAISHLLQSHIDLTHRSEDFSDDVDRVGSLTNPSALSHPMVVKPPVPKPPSLPNVPPEGERLPIPRPAEMRGRWECKCGIDVVPWNIVHCANQQSKRHKCPQPTYHRLCTDAEPARTKDGSPTEEVWFCEECKKKAWDRAESSDADDGDESDDDDVGGSAPRNVHGADASHDRPIFDAPDTCEEQREKSPNLQPRKKAKMTSTSNDEGDSVPAIMHALGTNLASLNFHGESSNTKRQAIGSLEGTDPKRPRIQEPASAEDTGSILSPGSVPDIVSPRVPAWGSKTAKKDGGPCRRCGRTKCTGWNKKLTEEEPPGDGKVWCSNCYHSDWRKKRAAKEKAEAEEAKKKAEAPSVLPTAQRGFAAQTEAGLKKERNAVKAQLHRERNKYWEMKDDDAPEEAMRAQTIVIDGLAAKCKQLQAAADAAAEGAASGRGI